MTLHCKKQRIKNIIEFPYNYVNITSGAHIKLAFSAELSTKRGGGLNPGR